MFSYYGTYKAEGNSLTTKMLSAWVPGWVGTERKSKFDVSGNTLTIESMPFKSTRDNVDVVVILKYERME
jgi:hypothetical protein